MDIQKFIDKYEEYKPKKTSTESTGYKIYVAALDFSEQELPPGGIAHDYRSMCSPCPPLTGFDGAKVRRKKNISKQKNKNINIYKVFIDKAYIELSKFKKTGTNTFYFKNQKANKGLRISNHSATASTFEKHKWNKNVKNYSIVIRVTYLRESRNKKLIMDADVNITEYVYPDYTLDEKACEQMRLAILKFFETGVWDKNMIDVKPKFEDGMLDDENLGSLADDAKEDNVTDKYEALCESVQLALSAGAVTNHDIKMMCQSIGIDSEDVGQIKEKIERALYLTAKEICGSDLSAREKYEKIISLYNRQPIVGAQKTLRQMAKQQYSTSLPVAYLMSEFVKKNGNDNMYFEPSAGNGFLTVALPSSQTICNEVDELRLQNLRLENYKKVMAQDGRNPFEFGRIFDGVVTNPPFLKEVDRMIFNALDAMKDNGRAAILRDGWNLFENYLGTELRNRNLSFYDKLIAEYNVVKIVNLDSRKVYAKQGTGFFMCVILIDGRRPTPNYTNKNRVYNPNIDIKNLCGFEELWDIFQPYITCGAETEKSQILIKELKYLNKK
jgi:hypothetical protein